MEGTITLNNEEQRLNNIIIKLFSKEINIKQACRLTGLSERQVYRKQKAYKELNLHISIRKGELLIHQGLEKKMLEN